MTMNKFFNYVLSAAAVISLMGCDESSTDSSLLTQYNGHVESAINDVESAKTATEINSALSEHYSEMVRIRESLNSQCIEESSCPAGNGLDGEYENGCFMHGSMMDSSDMMAMEMHEENMMNLMHTEAEACIASGAVESDCVMQHRSDALNVLSELQSQLGSMTTTMMSSNMHGGSGEMHMNQNGVCESVVESD